MQDQKLENLLNLALDASPEERQRSQELETGYRPEEQAWEVIVKYSGSLDAVRQMGVEVEEMRNEYAVLTVPEHLIDQVSSLPQIEYVEKPKRLFFAINRARAASCINSLQSTSRAGLDGNGTLISILDSGIDYFHEDFRNEDGTTRIEGLWDQIRGQVYTREEINHALETGNRQKALELVPSSDLSGHGTEVAGIAAGNGRGSDGRYRGIAYKSDLFVVKLGNPPSSGFPRTTELMRGINFVVTEAVNLQKPMAINISFGNTYGSHDGTSLLETFIDDIGNYGKTTIVVGSGNEGAAGGHTSGVLRAGRTEVIELSVAPYETGFSIQLWKHYADTFRTLIRTPDGGALGPLEQILGSQRYRYRNTQLLVYYGKPRPYSQAQEIYIDFIPSGNESYVDSGIWSFMLTPERVVTGAYDFWLPSTGVLNSSTRFLRPTPDTTLTIPSTAAKVITVGAYDSAYQTYADFSGRGFTRVTNQIKPDLAAPGVNLMTTQPGGGYVQATGTSFAAPVVTGSAALMMQWGIVNGNDPFLYGEKVKAYLIRGARQLPGFSVYPNPQIGYGVLCVSQSLPR